MSAPDELTAAGRLILLLEQVAFEKRPCRFCQKTIYLVKVRSSKVVPYTAEGINHFGDCPHFQKRPDMRQQTLIDSPGTNAFDPRR